MVKSFFYTKFSNISIDSHTLNMEVSFFKFKVKKNFLQIFYWIIFVKDGGEVFVEVCSDPGLSDDSPIIILLHTITGSSKVFTAGILRIFKNVKLFR